MWVGMICAIKAKWI